jgi:NADPH:quinone reductase
MIRVVRIHETGGPDVLRWESIDLAPPRAGEVRVRHTAVGLNFVDTYQRSGLYPLALPAVLGSEAAGVVEAVGPDVTGIAEGDRVAYASTAGIGAYAEKRNVAAKALVKLPSSIDDRIAAAAMLKGLTAHYLLEIGRVRESKKTIVVHAAAGGVGLLLSQWAKQLGATVIGTAGSEAKADIARAHGCDEVVLYRHEKLPERVRAITGGAGVDVVYDSIGKDTFHESLDSLRRRGLFVSFGQSSGPIGTFEPRLLAQKGSLFFTRPTLHDYAIGDELQTRAADLFTAIEQKVLKVRVKHTYPLRNAEEAHRDLEARKTTGSTLLLP